ncbi:hypothetical protein DFH07DRAFT_958294 [Mycena maculata]|uniref:Uncharacterized protein n=1 Tax=Mycena maculata TaxID=230809 RepID=A0AAD7J9L2_9AGAR|nr:hypothetical protein DFH07DRAFT_958294 [Mycena maculata]
MFSDEIIARIYSHCPSGDAAKLSYCSSSHLKVFRKTAYEHRQPTVGKKRVKLLLIFAGAESHRAPPILGGNSFQNALWKMENLCRLHIFYPVDVGSLARFLRARINTLTYIFPVCDAIYRFLDTHPTITSLSLHSKMEPRPHLPSTFLPVLDTVEALAVDLPRLMRGRPVETVIFRYQSWDSHTRPRLADGIGLLSAATTRGIRHLEVMPCQLIHESDISLSQSLPHLEYLLISQDTSWGNHLATGEYTTMPSFSACMADLVAKLKHLP